MYMVQPQDRTEQGWHASLMLSTLSATVLKKGPDRICMFSSEEYRLENMFFHLFLFCYWREKIGKSGREKGINVIWDRKWEKGSVAEPEEVETFGSTEEVVTFGWSRSRFGSWLQLRVGRRNSYLNLYWPRKQYMNKIFIAKLINLPKCIWFLNKSKITGFS